MDVDVGGRKSAERELARRKEAAAHMKMADNEVTQLSIENLTQCAPLSCRRSHS